MNTAFAVVQNKSSKNIMCLFLDPSEAHRLRDGAKKFLRMLITSSWSNNHVVDYLRYILLFVENLIILQLYQKNKSYI